MNTRIHLSVIALSMSLFCATTRAAPLDDAQAAFDRFDLDLANQHLDAAAKLGDSVQQRYLRTRILILSNQPDAAEQEVNACFKVAPKDSKCFEGKAEVAILRTLRSESIFSSLGTAREAKENWEKAFAADPNNARAGLLLLRFCRQAPWVAGGSESRARELERQLQATTPSAAHQARGLNLLADESFDAAAAQFKEASGASPNDRDPRFYLALTYLAAKQYANAANALNDLTHRFPNMPEAWLLLGTAHWQGELDAQVGVNAINRFLKIARNPHQKSVAQALAILGTLQKRVGDANAARQSFALALQSDEDNELAQDGIKGL